MCAKPKKKPLLDFDTNTDRINTSWLLHRIDRINIFVFHMKIYENESTIYYLLKENRKISFIIYNFQVHKSQEICIAYWQYNVATLHYTCIELNVSQTLDNLWCIVRLVWWWRRPRRRWHKRNICFVVVPT